MPIDNVTLTVSYNGSGINPTPIVNFSRQPVDYGYVWGYNTDISLDGLYTGINTTGAAISALTGIFGSQFKTLQVTDNLGATLYSWPNVTVESLSIDTNPYYKNSFVHYNVKLKSFDFPSGVMDPTNEYSFAQTEDGTVTVSHKVSARGVRGLSGAWDNAVAFVRMFTGKDPFSSCAPILVPSGSGVLLSLNETMNRAEGIYGVAETYKYNTGVFASFVRFDTLQLNDALDAEFKTVEYNVKIQGSPVSKNFNAVVSGFSGINFLTDIQSEYSISTTNWVKNGYEVNIDTGACTLDVRLGYVSGADTGGYFDYVVTCEKDALAGSETWKIDGEFKCFGPLDLKNLQLSGFKNQNSGNGYRSYVSGLITNSTIYNTLHDTNKTFSQNMKVNVTENPQLANFKLSATMEDGYEPKGLSELKFNWEGYPSRWIYELLPSATIEGAYVIQDLQARSQTRQKFTISAKATNVNSGIPLITGYLANFVGTYVNSGTAQQVTAFKIEDELSTGTYDIFATNTYLGQDTGVTTQILNLVQVGGTSDAIPLRASGYSFGY